MLQPLMEKYLKKNNNNIYCYVNKLLDCIESKNTFVFSKEKVFDFRYNYFLISEMSEKSIKEYLQDRLAIHNI